MVDQNEAARSARGGTLDRTTRATGQHYRDGFHDGFVARSARQGGKRNRESAREARPPRREEIWAPDEGNQRVLLGLRRGDSWYLGGRVMLGLGLGLGLGSRARVMGGRAKARVGGSSQQQIGAVTA